MRSNLRMASIIVLPMATSVAYAADQPNNLRAGITIEKSNYSVSNNKRYTCNAAMAKIRMAGYKTIKALRCTGSTYQFSSALKGTSLIIEVEPRNGAILKVRPN